MKNLRIASKMVVGFGVAIAMLIVVGVVGLISLNAMNGDYLLAVENHGKPLVATGHALADLHAARAEIRAAIIFSGNAEKVATQKELVKFYTGDFEKRSDELGKFFTDEESKAFFAEAMTVYPTLTVAIDKVLADAAAGVEPTTLAAFMVSDIKPAIDTIIGDVEGAMAVKSGLLDESVNAGTTLAQQMAVVLPTLIALAVIGSVLIGLYTSRLIRMPLACLTEFMKRAGMQGDISISPEVAEEVKRYIVRKDELGECFRGTDYLVKRITTVAEHMEAIANRDLTGDLELLSEKDTMGRSLELISKNLNDAFAEINTAASQVNAGSGQISDGAQLLASGSTEQAATAEELSAAIAEVSGQAAQNAELANSSAVVASEVIESTEKGRQQMIEMTSAVNDISTAGVAISKVIKVIDDIAFQTNILALNAAVEAARAGQQGKGFAVVADEVRNLAAKSAAAAKETADLIANSVEKSNRGVEIATATSQSFSDIASGILRIGESNRSMATASEAQNVAVTQIRSGIEQMTDVIQQNSATAEESAAASEELSSQAELLAGLVERFRLKDGAGGSDVFAPVRRAGSSVSSGVGRESGFAVRNGQGKY